MEGVGALRSILSSESLNNARLRVSLELNRHMQAINVEAINQEPHLQYEEKNKYHQVFEEK